MTRTPSTQDSKSVQPNPAGRIDTRNWHWRTSLLLVPPAVAGVLVRVTLRHHDLNEPFFANSAYYVLFAMFAVYVGVLLVGGASIASLRAWITDNRLGIAVTAIVAAVVLCAVAPGYRVLADEANLIGVSKNLFYQRTANFATTGKWYFENYWNINLTTDRRPALFPFLVSLLHVVRGYHPENAFHVNAIIFTCFVFSSYRLAKLLGGELFGAASAVLVAVHPNTMVAARSAGFDLLSSFMLLIVIKSFIEFANQNSPKRLAILALHLCILAHVRYEGWALFIAASVVLLAFRMVRRDQLRGYGPLYSIIPIFLLPRYWQAVAKAHDAEQPLSASLFSISHFIQNTREYLRLVLRPLEVGGAHSPLLIILAGFGLLLVLYGLITEYRTKNLSALSLKYAVFIGVLVGLETVISFSYAWGKSLHPASARLFIWLDTFVALNAAWFLTAFAKRLASPVNPLHRARLPQLLSSLVSLYSQCTFRQRARHASLIR